MFPYVEETHGYVLECFTGRGQMFPDSKWTARYMFPNVEQIVGYVFPYT